MRRDRLVFGSCLLVVTGATCGGLLAVRSGRQQVASEVCGPETRVAAVATPAAPVGGESADMILEAHTAAWLRELDQLDRDIAALRGEIRGREAAALAAAPRESNPWPNAGRAAPLDTLRTVQWAIHAADIDVLEGALYLDADAHAAARAFFQALDPVSQGEFRSPERLVASAIAAKSASAVRSAEASSTETQADGSVWMRLRIAGADGASRTTTLRFHPDRDGWRLQVPAHVVTAYRDLLIGPPIDPLTYRVVR